MKPHVVAAIAIALGAGTYVHAQSAPRAPVEQRVLPSPITSGGPSLDTVVAARHSSRQFGDRDLADTELGQLLWAAQGLTDGRRTAPSAGALYPLTIRVADAHGVWRYVPANHALVRESPANLRAALATASFGQAALHSAPAILVITARFAITARKYGQRAERFATLEAGHAAQNVLLEATALGLAAVPIGGFSDDAIRHVLNLQPEDTPLYLIAVGACPSHLPC